jgi:hypothetical protein
MATTEQFDHVRAGDLSPLGGLVSQFSNRFAVSAGGLIGRPLGKNDGYQFLVRIPALGTPVTTGLTFTLLRVDEASNGDASKVIRVGITAKLLASGTDTLTQTGASAEAEADLTSDATVGEATATDIAVATAALDVVAAGVWLLVQVRRIGTHANDTHSGRVILLGLTVRDT